MKLIKSKNIILSPLVSVVLPSYNRRNTIKQTIDSILNQNFEYQFELVIGDDGSTDNVKELLLEYQKLHPGKIVLLFHEKNIGLGANWASCVKLCRGKYLAGCDNDDYWHNPDKLELQVLFLEKNAEYGMVHTDFREHHRDKGTITEKVIHNETYNGSIIQTIFSGKFKCCNSSVMYRKSVIDEHINLDDYISNKFPLQDWNTWISIANITKFYCLPVSTTTVGIETGSITRPKDYGTIKKRLILEKSMYKYLCDKFPDELPFDEVGYDRYVNGILLNHAYKNSDFSEAKKYSSQIKELGFENLKTKMTRNKICFYIFAFAKKIRERFQRD